MTRRDEESEKESDNESDFSDIDYTIEKIPSQLKKIGKNKVNDLWNKQSGCCYFSNVPMIVEEANSVYSIDVAPRRISEPISDTNCVLVLNGVKQMHESKSSALHV